MIKTVLIIIVIIVSIILVFTFFVIGSFSKKPGEIEAILFSALEGKVIKSGVPVSGLTLTREWTFAENSIEGSDSVTTDKDGNFSFSVVTHLYRPPRIFAQERIIGQKITSQTDGDRNILWLFTKHDFKERSEAGENYEPQQESVQQDKQSPLKLVIDLDLPGEKRGTIYGKTLLLKESSELK